MRENEFTELFLIDRQMSLCYAEYVGAANCCLLFYKKVLDSNLTSWFILGIRREGENL